jgi:hypothetical protein
VNRQRSAEGRRGVEVREMVPKGVRTRGLRGDHRTDTTGETPHTSTNGRCRMGMEQERISDKDLQVEGCNEISPLLTTWCPRLSECCYF